MDLNIPPTTKASFPKELLSKVCFSHLYFIFSILQNDRETLQRIQMGDIDFDFELWQNISREAKHFVANLLVYKPEERMSVRQALAHPWLQILKQPGIEISEQYQISTERLRTYYGTLK